GRPARWMERASGLRGVLQILAAAADAGALVARDAERLRAVTCGAVRRPAARLDAVHRDVVSGMEVHRPHDALMARDALRAIVARGARRADLPRLLLVIAREAGTVLIAEAGRAGHERAVLEL